MWNVTIRAPEGREGEEGLEQGAREGDRGRTHEGTQEGAATQAIEVARDASAWYPKAMETEQTTQFVRRAIDGDLESVEWIVSRFSPVLLSQARHRLGGNLRELYDPEDLVNEVWCITLPRLTDIEARDGRYTPVLVKFLTRTLLLRRNTLVKKHLQGKPLRQSGGSEEDDLLAAIPAEVSGVVTRVVRTESGGELHDAIEKLPEKYREVLVLRGIEQNENQEVAAALGIEPNAVAQRFKRAKDMLREHLPTELREMFDALDG